MNNSQLPTANAPREGVPLALIRYQLLALKQAGYHLDTSDPLVAKLLLKELSQSSELIPVAEAGRIFKLCKTLLNEDSYGLDSRPSQAKGYIKPVFLSTINCRTLGAMLRKQTELVSYMGLDNEFAVTEEQGQIKTGFTRHSYPEMIATECVQANDIFHLYWWHRSYCWFIAESIVLSSVHIMGPESHLGPQLERLFDCPVHFDQPANCIQFDPHYLQQRVVRTAQEVEFFCDNIGEACEQIPLHLNTTQRVQNMLAHISLNESICLDTAAERLHCSRQTLIRRLRGEGTSFQGLKDQHRFSAASQMLADDQYSITEISAQLGFANSPAFTRAYRKWRGLTPSQARQQLRDDQTTFT